MKIFAIAISVLFLVCPISFAQTWVPTNQGTFGWDASTQLADGGALPAGTVVKYQPYVKTTSVSTPVKSGDPILELQRTIAFQEGNWLVGVSALRIVENVVISESAISWSDNPDVCFNGQTFGFVNILQLMAPRLLKPQQ